jgi:Holliday junction resolvase-like predicted endonuclease
LKRTQTERQRKVSKLGKLGERTVKEWLENRGFKIEEWFSKAHAGFYDIKASKGKEKWIIEVKTGLTPKLNVNNLLKMTAERNVNKIGLAIVASDEVILLEIGKQQIAAMRAWKKRKTAPLQNSKRKDYLKA